MLSAPAAVGGQFGRRCRNLRQFATLAPRLSAAADADASGRAYHVRVTTLHSGCDRIPAAIDVEVDDGVRGQAVVERRRGDRHGALQARSNFKRVHVQTQLKGES